MAPEASSASTSNSPESGEVRQHLEKILASDAFSNARRAQEFLRFVIEETLAGRASEIKEPMVAARVFHVSSKFDRRTNSIVRAEATHVRRRLHDYYAGAGRSDSLIIDLPRGAYLPFIRTIAAAESKPPVGQPRPTVPFLSWFRPGKSVPRQ